jgi:GntR family transcriptional regulator
MEALRSVRQARGKLRYEQVIELVERLIAEGDLLPGSRLPTNEELGRMAGVSQITVRRALSELEAAGRVIRHQGVGTFVAGERIVADPTRAGPLLATLGGEAGRITTRLLDIVRGMPDAELAGILGLAPDEQVYRVSRLRSIDGVPKILEDAVLPLRRVPRLEWGRLATGRSLYEYLAEEYGIVDAGEEQYLEVGEPDERERRYLRLPRGSQVVRIRGVSFDAAGVFDAFRQVYPADEFVFYISGSTARKVLPARGAREWLVQPDVESTDPLPPGTRHGGPMRRREGAP